MVVRAVLIDSLFHQAGINILLKRFCHAFGHVLKNNATFYTADRVIEIVNKSKRKKNNKHNAELQWTAPSKNLMQIF